MEFEWIDGPPSVMELALVAAGFGATDEQFENFLAYRFKSWSPNQFHSGVVNYPVGCRNERENYALRFVKEKAEKTLFGTGVYLHRRSNTAEQLTGGIDWIIRQYPTFTFEQKGPGVFAVTGDFSKAPRPAKIGNKYYFYTATVDAVITLEVQDV